MALSLCRRVAPPTQLRGTMFRMLSSSAVPKVRCVMLNSDRLDYDARINWNRVKEAAELTTYPISDNSEIVTRVQGADVVMNKEFPITAELIRAFPPSVKLIAEAGTGYNNIDIDACREKGIALCNVPSYTTESMAHMVICYVMALASSLAPQMKLLTRGDKTFMHQCHLGKLPHFEIQGKTMGIIGGLGLIGTHLSVLSQALGMKVVVTHHEDTPVGMRDNGVEVVRLDSLLGRSDFIVTLVRLNEGTRGIINAAAIDKMKPTAFIINSARGPLVDQDALIDALRKGKIAGAALDNFGEGSAPPPPPPDDSPLYDIFNEFGNVILTPHIGWQRLEARQRLIDMCADNIAAFARGEQMNIDMKTGSPRR